MAYYSNIDCDVISEETKPLSFSTGCRKFEDSSIMGFCSKEEVWAIYYKDIECKVVDWYEIYYPVCMPEARRNPLEEIKFSYS